MKKRKYLLLIPIIILLAIGIYLLPKAFGATQEVKSVTIESSGYSTNTPGSWHIEKSGMWTENGKARVTFDVNAIPKTTAATYKDVIILFDTSSSMKGDKIAKAKEDIYNLFDVLLANSNNRVALVHFDTNSAILSGLTNDKTLLANKVRELVARRSTNYNAAYRNVDEILTNYTKENNRDVIVLFLTDGWPVEEIPNQVATYGILKEKYPYLSIIGIQYELGKNIIEKIAEITDKQYIASRQTLNDVLLDAVTNPVNYENFEIVDYIDNDYFTLNSVDDIKVDKGTVSLEVENGVQKITWTIPGFMSGSTAKMDINLILKNEYIDVDGFYPTNKSEKITSKLTDENEEVVNSTLTPVLYQGPARVIYDNNTPSGCTLPSISDETHDVFENVTIKDTQLSCDGWLFKGWEIADDNVTKINSDTFIMPGHNVTIRGVWGKTTIAKSMDGTVYEKLYCKSYWQDPADGTKYCSGTNDQVNDNYVWYSGKLWRIVAIYPDGTMKLITEDEITAINWGSTVEYDGSWVYQWLNEEFYDTLYNKENIIVTNSTWNYSTDGNSTPVKPETIATQKTKTAPVGLLNAYEYHNATRNASYVTNYLNIGYYWWLITPYSTSYVWSVAYDGYLYNYSPSSFAIGVRPSINLKSGVELTGVGTKDNPYRIVGDMESPTNNVTLLSSRSSGEYVKFDGDLYRIVETSNGITKLTRVDYLRDNGTVIKKNFASSVYFGKSSNTQTDTYWDYYLNNNWYNSISSTYKNMLVDGTYYLGMYPDNTNYKATICKDTNLDSVTTKNCTKYTTSDTDKTFTGKVGLPRVGEMFSAQLGSGYSSSSSIWTITPHSDSNVQYVLNLGNLNCNSPSSNSGGGVRPSINLKSGIKIYCGSGTESDPFIIYDDTDDTAASKVRAEFECKKCNPIWKDEEDGTVYLSGTNSCIDKNYVWYSGKLWRITSINSDNTMKMVTENNITSIAYNERNNVNFAGSYMQTWLNEEFYPTLYNAENIIDTTKKWNATQTSNVTTKPDNTTLVSSNVGILNSWEYYNSYRNLGSYSSGYLNIGYFWWLLNLYSSSYVWSVSYYGDGYYGSPTSTHGGRPSIYLKSGVEFTGNGTKNDPYRIVVDKSIGTANDLINTRLSGEYVKLKNGNNEQLFRIIGVEDNKTKIIAMDYADDNGVRKFATSTGNANTLWGSGTTTDSDTWYDYLNNTYIPNLKSTYGELFDGGIYYLGTSGFNYKLSVCANTTSGNTKNCDKTSDKGTFSIGLPRYGEMFATQQSRGYSTSITMWLMNRYSTSYVWFVVSDGSGGNGSPTYAIGGRPTVHLKSTVKILSGSGTEFDPYVVGV